MISKKQKPPTLAERIRQCREEADELITKRAREIAKDNPGVPMLVIKQTLMRGDCICRNAVRLFETAEA